MTAANAADRGLLAVRRVREVRELDARLGLAQAQAEEHEHALRLDRLHRSFSGAARLPERLPGAELAARRGALLQLGRVIAEARAATDAAGRVTDAARAHWQTARTRTRAIDTLLERRAETRREDARRAEVRELDDIAGQTWLRRRAADTRRQP